MLLEAMGVHARATAVTGAARGVGARGVGGGLLRLLSVRTDGSLWHDLVEWRAWSDERYAAWLGRFWIAVLVKPTRLRFTGSTTPALYRGSTDSRARSGRAVVSAHPAPRPATGPAAVPCGPRRTAGRWHGSDGHRFAIRRCRRPAPRLEGGVPLALSRSPAEDGAYGPLLGQGRRGREAPLPSSEAPCARTGPSTRGDAAEGECRGPASTSIGRRRRGPSPRHVAHVGFPTTRAGDGRCPPRAPPASFTPTAAR